VHKPTASDAHTTLLSTGNCYRNIVFQSAVWWSTTRLSAADEKFESYAWSYCARLACVLCTLSMFRQYRQSNQINNDKLRCDRPQARV